MKHFCKNHNIHRRLYKPFSTRSLSLFLFTAITLTIIQAPVFAEDKTATINRTMTAIGYNMAKLFPILFREEEFKAVENQQLIATSIDSIVDLFKEAEPHFQRKSITFKTSYAVLTEHLHETKEAFEGGNLNYAQNLLKEAVSICTSCHTQDDKQRTLFHDVSRKTFKHDYEYGEFSFMTRNYSDAIKYYDNFLNKPHNKVTEKELLTALRRELTIFAQVYNDPGQGADHLREHLSKHKLTTLVKNSIGEWIKGLRELESSDVFIENNKDFKSLKKLVHQYLGELDQAGSAGSPSKKEKVFHVWLRGLLYQYLNKNPTEEEIPVILYWLAINDRATNYSFYYSLADLYLQECMLIYTKHPYAKKCYQEYEEYVEFSYSGSAGTAIPEDLKQELKLLKEKVYGS